MKKDEDNCESSDFKSEITEKYVLSDAMGRFSNYLSDQYNEMLSILGNCNFIYLKIDLKPEDCETLLMNLTKRKTNIVKIGKHDFEYIGQYKGAIKTSPVLKFSNGIYTFDYSANFDSLKNYMIENNFKNISKVKIQNVTRVEGKDSSILKYTSKANIYKVKINEEDFLTNDSFSDSDGFIYISTNKPGYIYESFGSDSVISIEKVGSTYLI